MAIRVQWGDMGAHVLFDEAELKQAQDWATKENVGVDWEGAKVLQVVYDVNSAKWTRVFFAPITGLAAWGQPPS